MLVDSHCHLNYKGRVEDQQGVLDRAREAGVTAMLNISTREREWGEVIAVADREPDVWASVGSHPHEADAHADMDTARLGDAAVNPLVVSLGETGLNVYHVQNDRDRKSAVEGTGGSELLVCGCRGISKKEKKKN